MPCQFCIVPTTHTLASCREIIPSVDKFRQKIEVDFNDYKDFSQFKRWLRDIRTPILRRLVKTFNEKMNQTRESLEQIVLKRLFKNVNNYIVNEIKIGNSQSFALCRYNNGFSCFARYIELYKSRISPDQFWGMCKSMTNRSHVLETMLQKQNIQEVYATLGLSDTYNSMMSTLKVLHQYISKEKKERVEYIQKKARFVLYRLNFNTDLFRCVMSFL